MTREELLELEVYCPNVFDDRVIVYLKLGFKVLFLFENAKDTTFYYLLTFDPNRTEDFINCIYKNYNKLHIVKDPNDIRHFLYNDIYHVLSTYFKIISDSGKRVIEITINETESLQQYINNFRYGHSD